MRVTRHRTGIAQTQVDILVTVDIGESRTTRRIKYERKRPRPAAHPWHRHTTDKRVSGLCVCRRLGVRVDEALRFDLHQRGEASTVNGAHQASILPFVE